MSEQKSYDLASHINIPHLWRGILDSYHNYYDIISELVQNSVDSVRKSQISNPKINICFDHRTQSIEVRDNGLGLSESDLQYFALGNTNKADEEDTIGEKGLGASFILGISDSFYVESVCNGKKIIAECTNAHSTIFDKRVPSLNYSVEDSTESNYCLVRIKTAQVDINIDNFSFFKYILRTRTAIGNTNNLFLDESKREKLEIQVLFIDKEGTEYIEQIPFLYLHLDELVRGYFPVFDAEYSKRNGKWIIDSSEIEKSPKGILRLVDYENQIYVTFAEVDIYRRFGEIVGLDRFPDDIVVSIKGCPTSVEVSKPRLGNAGYYTNFHIVLNGNHFTLDAGRKTINKENADYVREMIKTFFLDVLKFSDKFIGIPHDAIGEGAGLDQIKDRARATGDLKISEIPFAKIPRHEQSVVAIFHELLGAKVLVGYQTLLVSQYNTFDILFKYETNIENIGKNPREVYLKSAGRTEKKFSNISFGEFKLTLNKFCEDVNKDVKALEHVNLVICWDIGNIPKGWEYREIYPDEKVYDGANYIVQKIGYKKIHVMVLRDFDKND